MSSSPSRPEWRTPLPVPTSREFVPRPHFFAIEERPRPARGFAKDGNRERIEGGRTKFGNHRRCQPSTPSIRRPTTWNCFMKSSSVPVQLASWIHDSSRLDVDEDSSIVSPIRIGRLPIDNGTRKPVDFLGPPREQRCANGFRHRPCRLGRATQPPPSRSGRPWSWTVSDPGYNLWSDCQNPLAHPGANGLRASAL